MSIDLSLSFKIVLKRCCKSYRYNGAIFVLTYFLPLTATTYCYTRMSVELWGSQSIGEATPVQIESVNSKRRIAVLSGGSLPRLRYLHQLGSQGFWLA
ncbi:Tachykinin-like peptides receptor 99D [Amphibalanus amphitrite]|uniref:Tachykinin-like peptides receptor 99D n=1 Tax=Amphibalanus amphitrite TaxID=1232801 RepID=A0A6A4WW25_AMPAM|nr:Tachykinin-like peptides receptor 99D [Amphibalanus amphitrite]